jgi:hypothetical protein
MAARVVCTTGLKFGFFNGVADWIPISAAPSYACLDPGGSAQAVHRKYTGSTQAVHRQYTVALVSDGKQCQTPCTARCARIILLVPPAAAAAICTSTVGNNHDVVMLVIIMTCPVLYRAKRWDVLEAATGSSPLYAFSVPGFASPASMILHQLLQYEAPSSAFAAILSIMKRETTNRVYGDGGRTGDGFFCPPFRIAQAARRSIKTASQEKAYIPDVLGRAVANGRADVLKLVSDKSDRQGCFDMAVWH